MFARGRSQNAPTDKKQNLAQRDIIAKRFHPPWWISSVFDGYHCKAPPCSRREAFSLTKISTFRFISTITQKATLPEGVWLSKSKNIKLNLCDNLDLDQRASGQVFYCYTTSRGLFCKVLCIHAVEGCKVGHIRKEAGGLYYLFKGAARRL